VSLYRGTKDMMDILITGKSLLGWLYKNKGDSIEQAIEQDKKTAAKSQLCAVVECAIGTHYRYGD
jgi:hypothetical protein